MSKISINDYENRLGIVGLLMLLLSWSIFTLSDDVVVSLTGEDGPVEYLGMICWLGASIVCFMAFYKTEQNVHTASWLPRKNWIFIILGLLFLFAGGEEVSWGQRIFDFETPDSIREINMQSEFNIHNLPIFHALDSDLQKKTDIARWLTMERMFAVFWLGYCFLLPIAVRMAGVMKTLVDYFDIPVPPLFVGTLFMANYFISKIMEIGVLENPDLHWPSVETKESIFAALFLLVAVYFLNSKKRLPRPDFGDNG